MKYFRELPQALYPRIENDEAQQYVVLTNLLTRSAFIKEIIDNVGMYYEYNVKEDETPEIIAHKLYGSVERYWIVLLFNNLMNPFYDFPLNSTQLSDFIQSKYGYGVNTAQTTTHHYERRIKRTVLVNGAEYSSNTETVTISGQEANTTTGLAETNPYLPGTPDTTNTYQTDTDVIDGTTTVVTEYTVANVSVYTYELNENEKRRRIKLIDPQYVGQVEQEFKRLMNE